MKLLKLISTLLILLIVCYLAFTFLIKRNSNSVLEEKTTLVTPTETATPSESATESDNYKTEWLIVRQLDKVILNTNLVEQLSSEELKTKYLCNNLISGGFYSKADTHIGLFISEFKVLQDFQTNSLFNGFFYITDNKAEISQTVPIEPRLALQSGPLLIKAGKPMLLKIQNDSNERRIAVATLRDGTIAFIIVYSQKSHFQGPKLSEFPEILNKLQKNTSLKFIDALNLDGGTAAAFLTDSVKLPELSRIGSYFCIK